MSLSQKHFGKVFVPWFNSAEWKQVYNILCLQSDKNYSQALSILKIWKYRTPLLSAGVEGTLIILDALLTEKGNLLEHQLTQIYALSIMRFLNLCATNNEKQGTFYKTAVKNELPKWLINIRHDIAHDHRLPSISVLELGLHQCLQWIKNKYWQVQNEIVFDYIVTKESGISEVTDALEIYVKLNLNLLSRDIDISDYDEDIIEKLNAMMFKTRTQPTTDISNIITLLEQFLKKCLSKPMNDNDKEHVSKIVIHEALLCTEIEVTSEGTHVLPKDFRNIWSNLLNILNENNFIWLILKQLLFITNNIQLENATRETAALWISELFLGLQKVELVKEELNNIGRELNKTNIFKIKSAVEEKFPEYEDCLEFISTHISCSAADAQMFQNKILDTPSNYTLHFLEKVLQFNKNPENYIVDTLNLVKIMLLPSQQDIEEKIFTIDNLDGNIISSMCVDETDSEQTIVDDLSRNIEVETTRWKRIEDTSAYKGCPLGVLPHQNRRKNPLIF